MRLEQLQAFIAGAETGSFQKASRQFDVTQSTISRQVHGLEIELGLPLFHPEHKAKLTIGGERLLPHARKICQTWQTVSLELADLLAGKQPELCVAAIHSLCAAYLPPVLKCFCRDYPDVQLRVTALGSDSCAEPEGHRALKVLKDGLVDIAIVMNNRFFTQSPEMLVEVLYHEAIEVLMAHNHPLTKYTKIPMAELSHYPQVVFKDGYGMPRLVREQFARLGATLHSVLELNTLDAFRGVVRQGEFIALLPHAALIDARTDSTLAVRSIDDRLQDTSDPTWTRQVVIVTTKERMLIPPIKHFWELVRQLIPPQLS
jgi:DNA-binding transcriptional LysR family regulator